MTFFSRMWLVRFSFILLCSLFSQQMMAQCTCYGAAAFPVVHQRLVANTYVSPNVNGFTEVLPAGYNPNGSKRYPLIINFPGRGARGYGSAAELCAAACEGLGFKIEEDSPPGSGNYQFNTSVTYNGQTFSYIILTAQYNWSNNENASDVQAMIDYAVSHYKVDLSRIYLTGLSAGANMVVNFMSTSPQQARRVAAVISLGLCMNANNSSAYNMGTNRLHYWGMVGTNDGQCGTGNTINQSNLTNSYSPPGNPMGKYTLYTPTNPDPHIIWPDVHDKDFRVDGKNMAEWFIQYTNGTNATLPATLGSYEVVQKGKQVITNWSTSVESQTNYFIVERATPDMQFREIARVKAAGNSNETKTYSFTDDAPLKGTSFYRLSLINQDGVQEYYEVKKISNKQFGATISLSPVPANKNIQLSFELEQSQKVQFAIRDINGKLMQSWGGNFSSGYASYPINIEKLNAGVYFLSIQGATFSESKKFIKQ